MIQVPLGQIPAQTLYIILGDQNCTISVYWRQGRLYLDLSVDDVLICEGTICQNMADIVQSPSPDFSGTLAFFDLEGDHAPEWEGLHTGQDGRFVLVYLDSGEAMPSGIQVVKNVA